MCDSFRWPSQTHGFQLARRGPVPRACFVGNFLALSCTSQNMSISNAGNKLSGAVCSTKTPQFSSKKFSQLLASTPWPGPTIEGNQTWLVESGRQACWLGFRLGALGSLGFSSSASGYGALEPAFGKKLTLLSDIPWNALSKCHVHLLGPALSDMGWSQIQPALWCERVENLPCAHISHTLGHLTHAQLNHLGRGVTFPPHTSIALTAEPGGTRALKLPANYEEIGSR